MTRRNKKLLQDGLAFLRFYCSPSYHIQDLMMNILYGNTKCLIFLIGAILSFLAPTLHASSSFSGSAALTYNISNIINQTNPGDLTGLEIRGFFQPADAPAYSGGDYSIVTFTPGSVGGIAASNPSFQTSSGFTHTFSVTGFVNAGSVNSHQLGWYGLEFRNLGTDVYSISLAMNYQLNSAILGDTAASTVAINYFNNNGLLISGYDATYASFAMSSSFVSGTSGSFNFILPSGAGVTEGLYADVTIDSQLESVASVPLPAAVWSFLAGLMGILRLKKRNQRQASGV